MVARYQLVFLSIFACGCQQVAAPAIVWTKQGSTPQEYNAEISKCDYEISLAVPPTTIHPFTNSPLVALQDSINKSNTQSRADILFQKCMMARGWTPNAPGNYQHRPEEDRARAVEMTKKAIALIRNKGESGGFAEISGQASIYRIGTPFVICVDMKGKVLSHSGNDKIVGQNFIDMKDASGKYMMKDQINVAKSGSGWSDYSWTDPSTKRVEMKSIYVEKFSDDGYCGVAIIKP